MTRPLTDQVVVVLGASSGIGRATALRFARAGATVLCASRGVDALNTLVDQITAAGGRAHAVRTDITRPDDLQALVAEAEITHGHLDTWVTMAGVSVYGTIAQIPLEEFRRVSEVNYLGHVAAAQVAVPALERSGGGVLVGMASVEGVRSLPLHAPYTASKFAVRSFYDALRVELAADGARTKVSTILPAGIGTPFWEHSRNRTGSLTKPPPPVYAPELVAAVVARMATHPRRQAVVGGASLGFLLGEKLNPGLTDAVLSVLGRRMQTSDRPDTGTDILDTPTPGPGQVHGDHVSHLVRRDLFTTVSERLPRPGEALLALRARWAR
ncbi:SDR family oxidoreductase [Kineococcus aurantiacus]|uniref:NAD(P)-dependent dehydrogenase (Short-subunit alcohol dehydrogenase family) n=1 Tax=Kineococcus aurantiacus TaxID=37633 RepID=A0A7Y9J1I0_9ACTN|nr:NAD(P)-dependent dehydrogenase (short-subunit alcohol dehydrogenase family) [Kineococcus aurantiacus]